MNKTMRRFALVVSLTAIAGYAAGLLTAPKSGREIRGDIKRTGLRSKEEMERALKNANAELADLLDQAKHRSGVMNDKARTELDSLVQSARQARDKARTVVGALQSGDAEDDDLRVAVSKATSALNHLREYLKK